VCQLSTKISGSFAERDLQLKACYVSSPLCCDIKMFVSVHCVYNYIDMYTYTKLHIWMKWWAFLTLTPKMFVISLYVYMFPIMYLYIHVHPCMNEVVGFLDSDSKVFMSALCVYVYIYMCTYTTYKCMNEIVVILDSE